MAEKERKAVFLIDSLRIYIFAISAIVSALNVRAMRVFLIRLSNDASKKMLGNLILNWRKLMGMNCVRPFEVGNCVELIVGNLRSRTMKTKA